MQHLTIYSVCKIYLQMRLIQKKINIIKENYLNFGELSINVINELSHLSDMIQDYNRLKEECKKINKELLQFKKEYSILLNNFNQEKENMTNLIHEQKKKKLKYLKKKIMIKKII